MREIAAAAGIGKATLYDYFKTKDDILLFLFEREASAPAERAAEIARQELPTADKLRRIISLGRIVGLLLAGVLFDLDMRLPYLVGAAAMAEGA